MHAINFWMIDLIDPRADESGPRRSSGITSNNNTAHYLSVSARLLLQLHVHVRRDLDLRVGFLLVEARHDVQANQESWADFYVDKLLLPLPMQMVCRSTSRNF